VKVSGLNGTGLNPKCEVIVDHVCWCKHWRSFWQGYKVQGYKVQGHKQKATHQHEETRPSFIQPNLWHMSSAINKFMSWIMKGYIAQMKGFNLNWAKVATSTSKEKACRVVQKW